LARALISVADKRGVADLARGLSELGWSIVSTGGTARVLEQAGLTVTPVDAVTGFPEMMDGRLKTLHPKVHGGILARRSVPSHVEAMNRHGIEPIDLVAVNLYPFAKAMVDLRISFDEALEQIDIGGPAMLRSAAKNHESVLPIVEPEDYGRVLEALKTGTVDVALRRELAAKVFTHTAAYDSAIATYLARDTGPLPRALSLVLERLQPLRYGENPHQAAALYATDEPRGIRDMVQLHGKELSFNNLLDVEAASLAVAAWSDHPACAVIKHATPCGIAVANTAEEAYRRALATDNKSAFGSVVGFNTLVDETTAKVLEEQFVEVVVAPRYHDSALKVLRSKKSLRVVELPLASPVPALDYKRVRGGFLVQERFWPGGDDHDWRVVTKRAPGDAEWLDLRFAWSAVASVKSNAILIAKHEAAIGIGAGQMSRVDASFLAVHKARQAGHDTKGAALASDAFFPFADGVEEAARAGITAIIQPGGSVRDNEVIAAADQAGMAMVFTGRRQFRH